MMTLCLALALGDGIDEIPWMSSKDAFAKAQKKETARWVLIYKEWPR